MPHLQQHAVPFHSSSNLFFHVANLSELLSCIHTYYCINQHHNFLVMIHVNYDLVKLRAKRTGYVKSGVYVHTKKTCFLFFFFFVNCACCSFCLYNIV